MILLYCTRDCVPQTRVSLRCWCSYLNHHRFVRNYFSFNMFLKFDSGVGGVTARNSEVVGGCSSQSHGKFISFSSVAGQFNDLTLRSKNLLDTWSNNAARREGTGCEGWSSNELSTGDSQGRSPSVDTHVLDKDFGTCQIGIEGKTNWKY